MQKYCILRVAHSPHHRKAQSKKEDNDSVDDDGDDESSSSSSSSFDLDPLWLVNISNQPSRSFCYLVQFNGKGGRHHLYHIKVDIGGASAGLRIAAPQHARHHFGIELVAGGLGHSRGKFLRNCPGLPQGFWRSVRGSKDWKKMWKGLNDRTRSGLQRCQEIIM